MLKIFEFQAVDNVSNQASKLGMSKTALKKIIDNHAKKVISELTLGAQKVAKNNIPYDSGELRDQHIRSQNSGTSFSGNYVYIDSGDHTQYGRNKPIEASALANLLNIKPFRRSNPTSSTTTKGWIQDSHLEFMANKYKFLRNV